MSLDFKKESTYLSIATTLICGYVLFMHYVFNVAWANSGYWAQVVDFAQKAVPAIRRLHDRATDVYTSYWGLFFLGFWITSPIYWLLGFLGAPFLNENRYKIIMKDASKKRIVLMFSMFSLLCIFTCEFPVLDGMGIYNETSHFLPILLLTWWIVAMLMYYQGQICRVLWRRLASKRAA